MLRNCLKNIFIRCCLDISDGAQKTGDDFIAIPHNSNISKGYMFDETTLRKESLSEELASVRSYWEPIGEITQAKRHSATLQERAYTSSV